MTQHIKHRGRFVAGYGLLIACLLPVFLSEARGDQPTPDEIAQLRGVIEENFRAQTEEDVRGVLATISNFAPAEKRAELARELKACFEETDLQLKLVSFEIHNFTRPSAGRKGPPPFASATVVQLTTHRAYSYADLGEYPAELSTDYRHNSAMLPQTELVKYTVKLAHDGRAGWKAYKITSRVKPVGRWPGNIQEIMSPDYKPVATCATGSCRFIEKR
jgi:hypothetical protein